MAYYAKVNNGKVIQVIRAEADFFDSFIDTTPGEWLQTSYNTRGGVHYLPDSDTPSDTQEKAIRKNFAGVDYVYDATRDAFYTPQPHNSWTLNDTTCIWEPPVTYPTDGEIYIWNETAYQAALSDSSDTSVAWEQVSE